MALKRPWLTMAPPSCPAAAEKSSLPAMKSSLPMLRLVANRAPVFTAAVRPKTMPLRLSRNTWPLETRLPKIWVAFWSKMRFRAAAVVEGCLNWTVWPAPMLKLDQLTMSLLDCWLTTVVLELGLLMLPLPATTCPPWGLAQAELVTAVRASEKPAAASRLLHPMPCPSTGVLNE